MRGQRDDYEHSCDEARARAAYQRKPLSRARAYDIAIAFGLDSDLPVEVKQASRGGWDLIVPAEYFEGVLEALGKLEQVD